MIDVDAVRPYYADNDTAHSFDHVLRVWRLAERIGRAEGADLEILQAASLLHDVGRAEELATGRCHAEAGAEMARELLAGWPASRANAVAEAIAQHRFRGNGPEPRSLEARVLYDADKLDAIGAIGVARAYAVAGLQNQRLWAPVQSEGGGLRASPQEHTPVHEFTFKLARLAGRMQTATGRRLAQRRHEVMVAFFEELEREVLGEA